MKQIAAAILFMSLQSLIDPLKQTYDSNSELTKTDDQGLEKVPPCARHEEPLQPAHLFLLVHGLWGNASHMLTLQEVLQKSLPEVSKEKIVFLRPSSFQFWKTYDGVGRCAENVVADLFYEIETLKESERLKVTKLSVIGYSMGGLIARHVIGDLYALGFFDQVQPVFYTSFATPHVGVRFFRNTLFDRTLNFLGQHGFGKTGPQFFLKDSQLLLVEMSRPKTKFMKGLALFEKRLLLANIKNDRSVAFYTSFITAFAPFDSIDSVHIKYMRNLPSARIGGSTVWPKFVDLATTREVEPTEEFEGNVQEDPSLIMSNKAVRYTILAFAVVFLLPCYLPLVIFFSMIVSLYSVIKVRIVKSPDLASHWGKVRDAVYYGGKVDSINAKVGESRRSDRWKESLLNFLKGDPSSMSGSTLENVLQAEHNFWNRPENVIEDEVQHSPQILKSNSGAQTPTEPTSKLAHIASVDKITSSKMLAKFFQKPANEIDFEKNDRACKNYLGELEMTKADYPLFQSKALLPLPKEAQEIVENLNQLQWAKIPVYHDLFNAHGTIVGRRGGLKNPKATCTLYLWGSFLRNHLRDSSDTQAY